MCQSKDEIELEEIKRIDRDNMHPDEIDMHMSLPEKACYGPVTINNSVSGHAFLDEPSALDKQVGGGHYKGMKIQPVEFIVANNIPYREANVIKYTCRHSFKNGKEDIKKAIHYLEMILEDYDGVN